MSQLRQLSIVIPSYNARGLLRRTLRTLAVAAPEAEVLVVDGRSRDGSAEMVRDEFPDVRLFEFENHGFAHAVNRGLEHATRDYLLLLNSDLFATRKALEAMAARLASHRSVGAVAPVLTNEDGTRQHVFGAFYWPNFHPVRKVMRVPLLHAACLMTRREVLREVGGLDESFFLYNEEYDWCARVSRAGYRLEIVPERVVHVGGGSTPPTPELTLETQRGFLYLTSKHAPRLVTRGLRRVMQIEAVCASHLDPRPAHRAMWSKLASLTRRFATLESPFPLSGRGTGPAQPFGLAEPAVVRGEAAGEEAARDEIGRAESSERGDGPRTETLAAGSVVQLSAERARVSARRAARAASATR